MALTKEQYDSIMLEYTRIQNANRHILEARRSEIAGKIPEIEALERSHLKKGVEQLRASLLGGTEMDGQVLTDTAADTAAKKRSLLIRAGYPADYLEPVYTCPDCHDTGYTGNEKCHCFRAREIALLYHQSRIRDLAASQNFTTLSRRFYMGEDLSNFVRAEDASRSFVRQFETLYQNLYFYGNVGTGKSFLSICIAHELIERGHSVIYFSAAELFQRIAALTYDYRKRDELSALQKDLYDCDLLIIDDLGTESPNNLVIPNLFALINERHMNKKATVISSNLSMQDLRDMYTERISSRILSYYKVCKMTGFDIRMQQKVNGSVL